MRRWFALLLALLGSALFAAAALGIAPSIGEGDDGTAISLGKSVRGREISVLRLGDPNAKRKILVIGEIHGDERAGTAIAQQLARGPAPKDADVWIVPSLNPDGAASRTRQNANGVDLNRNFPWRWRHDGQPFDQQYSGPRALSEPEAQIAHKLILKLRPEITLWFHQPLGLVDLSGGDARIERRFARYTGLPARRLTRYHGSASSWQNRRLKETTAFVAELPAGRLNNAKKLFYARAIRKLIAAQK
jgi:protein MpaA